MSENGFNNEATLITALRGRDRSAAAYFVEQYSPVIYRMALRMLGDEQDAEDVLQETFIKAFQHLGGFDGRSRLSTWLYRIGTNEALMLLRKRKPERARLEVLESDDDDNLEEPSLFVDWSGLPEDMLLSSETRRIVLEAVEQLTPGLKAVFVLREIEGLSTEETAQALEIQEGAVKTRLSRARLQLRENLSAYFAEQLQGRAEL